MEKLCRIHKTEPIKYYCIDKFCIEPDRTICVICQNQKLHKVHHIVSLGEVQNLLEEHYDNTIILEKEGLKEIDDLCSAKIKKYLEVIESTLKQWQQQKLQIAKNLVRKQKSQNKSILNKIKSSNSSLNKNRRQNKNSYDDDVDNENEEQKEDKNYSNSDEDDSQENEFLTSDEEDDDDDDYDDDDDENEDEIIDSNKEINSEEQKIQKNTSRNKKVEQYLVLSTEENQFIMQALRDKKQKISQKSQIEGQLSQKFSDIDVQIKKLQRFINNKFSFNLKDFSGKVKDSWSSEYSSDCKQILQFNDEQIIVYAAENSIQLQNINEHTSEEIPEAHELSIVALEKMNENMIVSGSYDGMIKSWCPKTGNRLSFRNSYHISGVSCLKKLNKFHLVSGDEIGNVVISNVKNSKIIRVMKNKFTSDMALLNCIEVMNPQKIIITGSEKGQVDFWDYSKGEIVRQIQVDSNIIGFFLPTSFLLMIGQSDGCITCWDCRQGIKVRTYEQDINLTTIKRLGTDTFMASYLNKKVKFFSFMSQKPFKQIEHDEDVIGILPLYKNNQIVTLDICELTLWE